MGAIVRQALALAIAGIALGLAGALALTRVLTALLFDVGATDPAMFAMEPALLVLVALPASYVPARRAASVDPVAALRGD